MPVSSNILKNTHFRVIFLSCCLPRKHDGHLNFFPLPDTFLENVTFLVVLTSCLSMKHYHYFFLLLRPVFESNFSYSLAPSIKEYSLAWELFQNSELQLLSTVSHYYNKRYKERQCEEIVH